MLLPMPGSGLRQRVDAWLAAQELSVRVVGEFEDIETMRVFGQRGQGLFLEQLPLVADDSLDGDSELVGWLPGIKESIYALSPERRAHRLDVKRILENTQLPSRKSPRSTRS
jgi:DNA-binding transcriptional LysR family regulator